MALITSEWRGKALVMIKTKIIIYLSLNVLMSKKYQILTKCLFLHSENFARDQNNINLRILLIF